MRWYGAGYSNTPVGENGHFVEFTHKYLTVSTDKSIIICLCYYVNFVAKYTVAPRIVCILTGLK